MIEKRKYPVFAKQAWDDVFFMHWKVAPEILAPQIPAPLQLDLFDQSAWITVVCFVAKNSQLRFLPINFVAKAIQTNVRTYVTMPHHEERGVYFLNTFVNNRLATLGARTTFHLPFHYVEAELLQEDGRCTYINRQANQTMLHVSFEALKAAPERKLAEFLTERYAIWNMKHNRMIKIPIFHRPWTIHTASATIFENKVHPLIQGSTPDFVHQGDHKLSHLYPYETVGLFD